MNRTYVHRVRNRKETESRGVNPPCAVSEKGQRCGGLKMGLVRLYSNACGPRGGESDSVGGKSQSELW